MSLATRCTSCHTAFRVVQDQLKVSEGWVRCGRCGTVFNALEALFDLDRDAPEEPEPEIDDAAPRHEEGADFLTPSRAENARPASAGVSHRDRNEFADAQFNPDLLSGDSMPPGAEFTTQPDLLRASVEGESRDARIGTTLPPMPGGSAPDFIRHAEARARWNSPRARRLLSLATLALVLGLALQAVHQFHDEVAARWPRATDWLTAWCDVAGCRIDPPLHIGDVVVDSTSLYRSKETPDVMQLTVTLRNRNDIPVAMPSIDLVFKDESGRLVSRRVLSPLDFQEGPAVLNGGAEVPLRVHLSAADLPVVHYDLEPFYP
jgi:predicted Zn finger-like uncharacterized protein